VGQLGSVYKQPETEVDDSCHSWRVPSKWKGCKREQGELARGARGSAPYIYVIVMYVQKNVERLNNAAVMYIIIITRMNVVDNLNPV
jgi:hypothetical protein